MAKRALPLSVQGVPPRKSREGSDAALSRAFPRALLLAVAVVLAALLSSSPGRAQQVAVPPELQADLFSKLASYDRNFKRRAGPTARVLLVTMPGDAKSRLFISSMKSALAKIDRIGGLPHEERVVEYENAPGLAKLCRAQKIAAAYLGPGFGNELEALRTALSGVDVLSLGATPDYVPKGVVLSFDLLSGKPKIVFDLNQARKQNVDFPADVLKLMKVYR